MEWNPYTDQKNRAFSRILTTLFPEQTKTLPGILSWSVIFLIELTAFVFAIMQLGLLDWCNDQSTMLLAAGVFVVAFLGVFRLQGWVWNKLMGLFRN